MSNYWDSSFLRNLKINNIKTVFEVGARYGDESKQLKLTFPNSKIYSFECNPLTIEICKKNLKNIDDINFYDFGLGDQETLLPFYSYIKDNIDGASSLLKRIDYESTQKHTGFVNIKCLETFVKEKNIPNIDLLCMDVQGYLLSSSCRFNWMHANVEHVKN